MKWLKKIKRWLNGRPSTHADMMKWVSVQQGLKDVEPELVALLDKPDGLVTLNARKARRDPVPNVDYMRALHFWKLGQMTSVKESLKEELRYFPDNALAARLQQQLFPAPSSQASPQEPHWAHVHKTITPYTMLSEARLQNIYQQARRLCLEKVHGNFVECGVAAGGSSALLASVIKDCRAENRRVFSFDTFEGMPDPGEFDTHQGTTAQDTGWGAGTCAAAEGSLLEVCQRLDVVSLVTPVKGLFADTLPHWVERIGPVAFLHVDGDWYSSTIDVLSNLFDSVVPGGVIQFDDYGYWDGCRRAVHEFMEQRKLPLNLHKIDQTGVWMTKA